MPTLGNGGINPVAVVEGTLRDGQHFQPQVPLVKDGGFGGPRNHCHHLVPSGLLGRPAFAVHFTEESGLLATESTIAHA
jgi:hypothetical protein